MSDLMLFDLGGVDVKIPAWIQEKNFVLATSIEQVHKFVDEAIEEGICGLDLESEGLDNRVYLNEETQKYETVHKIVGFCIAKGELDALYVPIRHKKGENLDIDEVEKEIVRLVEDTVVVFHHAKYDCEMLEFMGNPCPINDFKKFEDTLIASFIRDPNSRHGLKALSKELLDMGMISLKDLFPPKTKKLDFSLLNPSHKGVTEYGCSDAYCTLKLWRDILSEVAGKYKMVYMVEKRMVGALRRMERPRVLINKKLIAELKRNAEDERAKSLASFKEQSQQYVREQEGETEIDILSPKQLSDLLYNRIGIKLSANEMSKGKTDQISTGQDLLDKIRSKYPHKYPILETITAYRIYDGIITKYLEKLETNLDKNNEARLSFNGWAADTARLSSPGGPPDHGFTGVNFHSLPNPKDTSKPLLSRRIREAVKARDGYALVKIDFSGEELRIATNVSGEPKWIKEFLEGNGDLHSLMAIEIFGNKDGNNRSHAKNTNFALLYGGGVGAVQRNTKLPSHEVKRIVDKFFVKLPKLSKWRENQKRLANKDKIVYSDLGRPFPLPQMDSDDPKIRAYGERKAINSPIQGTGADIIKFAMGEIDKVFMEKEWYPNIARMLINVHDELVFEIKLEHLEEVVPVCCDCMTLYGRKRKWQVPLEVEPLIDLDWSSKHDWIKMKAGKKPVPEWLKPYFTPDKEYVEDSEVSKTTEITETAITDTKELKISEKMKHMTPSDIQVEEHDEYIFVYPLKVPLNDITLATLRNVCSWSRIPLISEKTMPLAVKDINGVYVLTEADGVRVDVHKFRVLAELFGL